MYTYITSTNEESQMHEQPEPTPEEEERAPEEQEEHEAMRGPGHEDPPDAGELHDA